MAFLDAADCAKRVKYRLNRPASDTAFTDSVADDVIYAFMSEAQDRLSKLIATFIPDALLTAPTALTTADNGITYKFGNDVDSQPYFALGNFMVFAVRTDIPDNPLNPGVDYTIEGTIIRIPNNTGRTFGDGGPWAQTVKPTNIVASGTEPTIPAICRLAMVEDTARRCARRLGLDSAEFEQSFQEAWTEILAAVRTAGQSKGGATINNRPRSFWTRRRFG